MRRPLLFLLLSRLLLPPLLLRLCDERSGPVLSPLKKLAMWPLLDDVPVLLVVPEEPRLLPARSTTKSGFVVKPASWPTAEPFGCPTTCQTSLEGSSTAVRGISGCDLTIIDATGLHLEHAGSSTSANPAPMQTFCDLSRPAALPTGSSSEWTDGTVRRA